MPCVNSLIPKIREFLIWQDKEKIVYLYKLSYMPLKKVMKGLEISLQAEKEIHPKTKLGVWFHIWKLHSIQSRIDSIKKELLYRKTKTN